MEVGHMKMKVFEYLRNMNTKKDVKREKLQIGGKIIKSKKCVRRTFEMIIQELITRLKL